MKNQDIHLNEDQIIRATVDENDLTTSERNHLSKCSICQKEKQEFEQVLNRMGDMSKELVPSSHRRFAPVVQESRSLLRWRIALTTGFAIFVLMMGIWWTSPFTRFQENGSVQIVQKMESDQQLMAEIMLMEEYALPDRYLDIIGKLDDDDYDDYYNDEFLEFVLPL
jgi:hypothetical protein